MSAKEKRNQLLRQIKRHIGTESDKVALNAALTFAARYMKGRWVATHPKGAKQVLCGNDMPEW